MADNPDVWSWKKLLLGMFDGRNYAKALVFGLCLTIMLSLGYCVVTVVKARFVKPIPIQTQAVGTNSGTIATSNDTSTTQVIHHHYPLSDILNLFHWEKIDRKEIKKSS